MSWIADELSPADLNRLRAVTRRIMREKYNRDLDEMAVGRRRNPQFPNSFVDTFIESLGPVVARRLLKQTVDHKLAG